MFGDWVLGFGVWVLVSGVESTVQKFEGYMCCESRRYKVWACCRYKVKGHRVIRGSVRRLAKLGTETHPSDQATCVQRSLRLRTPIVHRVVLWS